MQSLFLCNKLSNSEFCAILVHFFDIKKVSQVYFTITYETISAERQVFELLQDMVSYSHIVSGSISDTTPYNKFLSFSVIP